MRFISLFAGIGGFDLGLERAGMECVAQVEIDEFCLKVLNKHWANVPKFKDVRDVGKENLPAADLICGGFPCQDVSLAGKRAGLKGKRSTLWSEFYRIICEIRPRWIVIENVRGLFTSDDGRFFAKILRELSAVGYDAEWNVVPASAVGTPHIRKRVFIVAYPAGERWNICEYKTPIIFKEWSLSNIIEPGYRWERQNGGHSMERVGWTVKPEIHGSDDDVPDRVDRLRALGNAVVPQVAEFIGRCIMEVEHPGYAAVQ